tara:strand:+ start:345 stop:1838 length:1494 start_codon:yes stop_codon:yes gene_type:complete
MSFITRAITPFAASNAGSDSYFYSEYDTSSTLSSIGNTLTVNSVDVDDEENIYIGGETANWRANDTTPNWYLLKINSTTGEVDWVRTAGYNNESEGIYGVIYDSYNDNIFTYGNAGGGNSNSFAVAGSTVFRRWSKDGAFVNLLLNGSPYPGTSDSLVRNVYNAVAISPIDGDIFGLNTDTSELRTWTYNQSTNTYTTPTQYGHSSFGSTWGLMNEIYWHDDSEGPTVIIEKSYNNGSKQLAAKLSNFSTPGASITSLKEYSGTGLVGDRYQYSGSAVSQIGRVNASGHLIRAGNHSYSNNYRVGYMTMNDNASPRYAYSFVMSDRPTGSGLSNPKVTWGDGTNIITAASSYDGTNSTVEIFSIPENSTTHNWRSTLTTSSPSNHMNTQGIFKISETRFGLIGINENNDKKTLELFVLPVDGSVTGTLSRRDSNDFVLADTSAAVTFTNSAVGSFSSSTRTVSGQSSGTPYGAVMNTYTSNPESTFTTSLTDTVNLL